MDFTPNFQATDSFLYDLGSPDLTTCYPTFKGLELPSPTAHNNFGDSYQTSDPWATMSFHDVFPALLTSPHMDSASLAASPPHDEPPASDPMIGSAHSPANQNSNWKLQHMDLTTAVADGWDTHQPSELGRAVIPRVPNSTPRISSAL